MKNNNPVKLLQLIAVLAIAASSCKKDHTPAPAGDAKPVTIGLFETDTTQVNNGTLAVDNRILIPISKIGTQTVVYNPIFDTGSTGLTIYAGGVVPVNMFSPTDGFNIASGDSLVTPNGITITSHASTMSYGNAQGSTTEYGNLAYASITIANQTSSGITGVTIKRVPIFLFYKIEDQNNKIITASHGFDIFGVGPGVSYTNSSIASPLSYYSPGTGLTNGFKLATLVAANFINGKGVYVESLLTLGLTSADLNSSGFIMHPLSIIDQSGYSPDIPGTITYNGTTISATLLFDTGTPSITIIEKPASISPLLPENTVVTVKTNKGFTYTYTTTSTNNFTEVQNPQNTRDNRSIFSIDFFEDNEFLTDYAGHQIGLKNN
jgi:hypothetical protein